MSNNDQGVFHGIQIGLINVSLSDDDFWFQPKIVAQAKFSCEKCGNTLGMIVWGMRYIKIDDEVFEYRKSILQMMNGQQVTRLEGICECGCKFIWEPLDILSGVRNKEERG